MDLRCSVVIASHEVSESLFSSTESVLKAFHHLTTSWGADPRHLECIIVLNGLPPGDRERLIRRIGAFSGFMNVVCLPACGLTRALVHGCRNSRGTFIARLDVGDAMDARRLQLQLQHFSAYPSCVLATSDVEVCGPCWEPLWINRGSGSNQGEPQRVDTCPPEQGIAIDIPHHASVMFRRSAYEAVGGYRPQFYFGQDWDLWYRLAGQGTFVHIPEVLTRVRLFPGGISSRHWREQRAIAQLSLACHGALSRGESELPLLEKAAKIRPRHALPRKRLLHGARAEGAYFIAEALRRNKDQRCWGYFLTALRDGFWKPRIWLRAAQSLLLLVSESS